MSDNTPEAGWFQDPWNVVNWRWWDGSAWTHHTAPMESSTSADGTTPTATEKLATVLRSGKTVASEINSEGGVMPWLSSRRPSVKAARDSITAEERDKLSNDLKRQKALKTAQAEYGRAVGDRERRMHRLRAEIAKIHESSNEVVIGVYRVKKDSVELRSRSIRINGQTFPLSPSVTAEVDTAGNLAHGKRYSLTAMGGGAILFGPVGFFAGSLLQKGTREDKRELYLAVRGDGFGAVLACKPDDGTKVRQLAMAINVAAAEVEGKRAAYEDRVRVLSEALKREAADDEQILVLAKRIEALHQPTLPSLSEFAQGELERGVDDS